MSSYDSFAKHVYQHCEQLAAFTQSPGMVDRQYLTAEHKQANNFVANLMQQAGMKTWQDEAGNIWGRLPSPNPNAKALITGSHLDTVPNGGKYDGILGVVLPIAYAQYCFENNTQLPFHLDIVGFADEEGSRFGTTLLGSRAITGHWQDKWANVKDNHDICLAQAMRDFGMDINQIQNAARDPHEIIGFLEVHIEQGPVLEAKSLPVGVVTAIAGANRLKMTVKGKAGHAGTVPMAMRNDALTASSEIILAIEKYATEYDVVATTGFIENTPNAVNVIPGECTFSLDIRSQNDALRKKVLNKIVDRAYAIGLDRNVEIDLIHTHQADAVQCDNELINTLSVATSDCNIKPLKLASGAGHDAMAMSDLCPVAMLFMRCEKGISHHPDESVNTDDIAKTIEVLGSFLSITADKYRI